MGLGRCGPFSRHPDTGPTEGRDGQANKGLRCRLPPPCPRGIQGPESAGVGLTWPDNASPFPQHQPQYAGAHMQPLVPLPSAGLNLHHPGDRDFIPNTCEHGTNGGFACWGALAGLTATRFLAVRRHKPGDAWMDTPPWTEVQLHPQTQAATRLPCLGGQTHKTWVPGGAWY